MMLQQTLNWIGGAILKMDLTLFLVNTLNVSVSLCDFILMDLYAFLLFKLFVKKIYILQTLKRTKLSFSIEQVGPKIVLLERF